MEIAGSRLADRWNEQLETLPAAVGDAAYDDALVSITRRALRGVDGFRDERGDQSPVKIEAYVKRVVDVKVKSAWFRTQPTVRLDELVSERQIAQVDHDPGAVSRLRRDRDAEDQLRKARDEWEAFERRAREVDARRMNLISTMLVEHGIARAGAELVMLRAARDLTIDVVDDGLEVRYLPATGLFKLAEQIGVSPTAARQLFVRTRRRLPPMAALLIDDPEAYARMNVGPVDTAGTRPSLVGEGETFDAELGAPQHEQQVPENSARRLLAELERLIGARSVDEATLERAARVVAAEQSWRDGLGVLLNEDDVAQLLGGDRDLVAQLAADGEMIVLGHSDGVARFPAFQFQDGRPTPALARAHRTLVESGQVSPESAASWARTGHPELESWSPARWAGEHRDDELLLQVARRDAARAAQ